MTTHLLRWAASDQGWLKETHAPFGDDRFARSHVHLEGLTVNGSKHIAVPVYGPR
ncbi:hypothetical protein [Corallococcus sp. CA049B]|uniref:hypothetical protein n=1 Tax=Corallococcus sp. CA049B TaxID=2316730 RepID=UPI001315236E|nr:hypothetical protein [Corallococcus sp. CA049B]